jgi:hypothetical protein
MSTPRNRRRLPSARRCHAPGPVPPPRFPTALTACSIRRLRVCCTPLPARGSPRFMTREANAHPKATLSHADTPRDAASHPSKDPPRRQPCRVTAAVALLSSPLVPRLASIPGPCLRRTTVETVPSLIGLCRGAVVGVEHSSEIRTGVLVSVVCSARPGPPRISSLPEPPEQPRPRVERWVGRLCCSHPCRHEGGIGTCRDANAHDGSDSLAFAQRRRDSAAILPEEGDLDPTRAEARERPTRSCESARVVPSRRWSGLASGSTPSGTAQSPVQDGDAPAYRSRPPRHHDAFDPAEAVSVTPRRATPATEVAGQPRPTFLHQGAPMTRCPLARDRRRAATAESRSSRGAGWAGARPSPGDPSTPPRWEPTSAGLVHGDPLGSPPRSASKTRGRRRPGGLRRSARLQGLAPPTSP